jgi:signal transduction histidine kinase
MTPNPQPFIIDDLLNELYTAVKNNLQTAGKQEIEVEIYRYKDDHACCILADRELLRQVLAHLLDNAVKCIERGFIIFGYHVLNDNLVDFFVDDTRGRNYDDAILDLSAIHDLLQQIGSRLNDKTKDVGSSLSFSIKSTQIEVISG